MQDVVIEPKTWRVWKKGVEIRLPNREFELLRFLAQNPNIVFSKEELFEKIWGFDYASDAATVSVHINRLREKLEDDPRNPRIIQTVWGRATGCARNIWPADPEAAAVLKKERRNEKCGFSMRQAPLFLRGLHPYWQNAGYERRIPPWQQR